MKVRMVWVQGDDATWLEAAWDEETVAANYSGWCDEVDKARKMAHENNYEMRIQIVDVPKVYELFEVSEVKARVLSPALYVLAEPTDEMVERVAVSMVDDDPHPDYWRCLSEPQKEWHRGRARRALDAAFKRRIR